MATKPANRIGRRAPLSLRTTETLRAKLDDAASASGRTLTHEIEYRLERSFELPEFAEEVARQIIRKLLMATEP